MKITRSKHGFSLVELLTVIAIIAILAAIIFPVMTSVKARAKETQCITNLQQIASALKMFQMDNRRFPETIAGYVQTDSNGVIPLERTKGDALYPEYIKSVKGLHCPLSNTNDTKGVISINLGGTTYNYYAYSSYDAFTTVPVTSDNSPVSINVPDLRYQLTWAPTKNDVTALNPTTGDPESPSLIDYDYKRQLRFRNPSDDTVVTWCSSHRKAGDLKSGVLVLFLDGHVDKIPGIEVEGDGTSGNPGCRWRIHPKK